MCYTRNAKGVHKREAAFVSQLLGTITTHNYNLLLVGKKVHLVQFILITPEVMIVSHKSDVVDIKYYKDIHPQEVKWLWYPYIPFGKITIVQGDPGEGKSTFAMNLCSMLTKGKTIPFSKNKMEIGNVIYQNNEDGKGDTIVPRLISCGADLDRIAYVDEGLNCLDMGSDEIEKAIDETRSKLIILDPIQAYIGKDTDMNRAGDIRPVMKRLSSLAEKKGCAILLIGHMSKNNTTKGLYRSLGSIDIPAAARSVLLISRFETEDFRIMAQVKNNLAPLGDSLVFSIDHKSNIKWLYTTKITADQVMNDSYTEKVSKLDRAICIITECLSKGKCLAGKVFSLCEKEGISERTIKAAKAKLNILSKKSNDGWVWELAKNEE